MYKRPALDRLSQAVAHRGTPAAPAGGFARRHPYLLAALVTIAAGFLAGLVIPALQSYPEAARLSTSPFWAAAVEWINVTFFDTLGAVKTLSLIHI